MNLTLRQLCYIAAVAESGSIAAAARECRIAQSSILAALDQAEVEMGARLFDRRPSRGVVATPAGGRFLASARRLLVAEAEFERTMDRHNQLMPPVLRIGCFEPFGALFMPELLRRFTEGADIEVQLYEGEQPQLLAWLEASTVDAIVTYDIGTGRQANRYAPRIIWIKAEQKDCARHRSENRYCKKKPSMRAHNSELCESQFPLWLA